MRKTSIIALIVLLLLGASIFFLQKETEITPSENKDQSQKPEEPKTYKLAFVGDIMLSRSVGKEIDKSGDPKYPFLLIGEKLKQYDLTVGNLEGPISDKGANQGSIYSFRAKPETAEGLKFAGFDVLSLANNHMWDWGKDALLQTKEILSENGIAGVGAGQDYEDANTGYTVTVGTTTIGFLSYTNLYPNSLRAGTEKPGISDFSYAEKRIKEMDSQVDLLVVLPHWGDEYKTKSNTREQAIAHAWIDAGADLIIGHHPHVIQEIEEYKGKYIAYSLGNFVFDQYFSTATMSGLLVEVDLKDGKFQNLKERRIVLNSTYQPNFAD